MAQAEIEIYLGKKEAGKMTGKRKKIATLGSLGGWGQCGAGRYLVQWDPNTQKAVISGPEVERESPTTSGRTFSLNEPGESLKIGRLRIDRVSSENLPEYQLRPQLTRTRFKPQKGSGKRRSV